MRRRDFVTGLAAALGIPSLALASRPMAVYTRTQLTPWGLSFSLSFPDGGDFEPVVQEAIRRKHEFESRYRARLCAGQIRYDDISEPGTVWVRFTYGVCKP